MQKLSEKLILLIGSICGWFAIITQSYLLFSNRVVSVPETILRFFGYFTIDTNIIAALCFTFLFLKRNSRMGKFFSKPTTVTAVTVYIAIVGIVYNTILRSTWNPHGLQKLADELLHSAIPALFILYWVLFVPVSELKWKHAFLWLIYPVVYITYGFILGALSKFYPYPFANVITLGYGKSLLNSGGILLVIFFLSLVAIGAGKFIKKSEKKIT